ncbi:hypothetical protein GWI33_023166 [Rhynchophorus ferrugineus]|nr:hypothetical protein GWI33_023166 [Rhynchophorus ferrugineus]
MHAILFVTFNVLLILSQIGLSENFNDNISNESCDEAPPPPIEENCESDEKLVKHHKKLIKDDDCSDENPLGTFEKVPTATDFKPFKDNISNESCDEVPPPSIEENCESDEKLVKHHKKIVTDDDCIDENRSGAFEKVPSVKDFKPFNDKISTESCDEASPPPVEENCKNDEELVIPHKKLAKEDDCIDEKRLEASEEVPTNKGHLPKLPFMNNPIISIIKNANPIGLPMLGHNPMSALLQNNNNLMTPLLRSLLHGGLSSSDKYTHDGKPLATSLHNSILKNVYENKSPVVEPPTKEVGVPISNKSPNKHTQKSKNIDIGSLKANDDLPIVSPSKTIAISSDLSVKGNDCIDEQPKQHDITSLPIIAEPPTDQIYKSNQHAIKPSDILLVDLEPSDKFKYKSKGIQQESLYFKGDKSIIPSPKNIATSSSGLIKDNDCDEELKKPDDISSIIDDQKIGLPITAKPPVELVEHTHQSKDVQQGQEYSKFDIPIVLPPKESATSSKGLTKGDDCIDEQPKKSDDISTVNDDQKLGLPITFKPPIELFEHINQSKDVQQGQEYSKVDIPIVLSPKKIATSSPTLTKDDDCIDEQPKKSDDISSANDDKKIGLPITVESPDKQIYKNNQHVIESPDIFPVELLSSDKYTHQSKDVQKGQVYSKGDIEIVSGSKNTATPFGGLVIDGDCIDEQPKMYDDIYSVNYHPKIELPITADPPTKQMYKSNEHAIESPDILPVELESSDKYMNRDKNTKPGSLYSNSGVDLVMDDCIDEQPKLHEDGSSVIHQSKIVQEHKSKISEKSRIEEGYVPKPPVNPFEMPLLGQKPFGDLMLESIKPSISKSVSKSLLHGGLESLLHQPKFGLKPNKYGKSSSTSIYNGPKPTVKNAYTNNEESLGLVKEDDCGDEEQKQIYKSNQHHIESSDILSAELESSHRYEHESKTNVDLSDTIRGPPEPSKYYGDKVPVQHPVQHPDVKKSYDHKQPTI